METIEQFATVVAAAAAPHAQRHDTDGTFVVEGVSAARDLGYLAAPVPTELGGAGARVADLTRAQRIIARSCGSTGLAAAMHLHVVAAAAWRWRRGDTVVEPMLRKVAADHLVVASTGGKDWTHPTTVATPTEGGWRIRGRKTFVSIAPMAGSLSGFAVIGEPRPGAEVIAFGCPLTADGVTLEESWDAIGMRGTGSHDIVFDDVFIAESQVMARRSWGELDRPLIVASLHAWPIITATYLGVADALADAALVAGAGRSTAPRLAGLIDAQQRTAHWALAGALAELGDDPDPTWDHHVRLQQVKRVVALAGGEIARAGAELAGGGAYARRGPIDRMIRDLQAAIHHPYPPEETLDLAGRHRLEQLSPENREVAEPALP
jgi:alkylation response protein AidB-like acyl-CoA dehydrogenase